MVSVVSDPDAPLSLGVGPRRHNRIVRNTQSTMNLSRRRRRRRRRSVVGIRVVVRQGKVLVAVLIA